MIPDEQFHTFVRHGASEPASEMLSYPLAHARLGNVSLIRCIPLVLQHGLLEEGEGLFEFVRLVRSALFGFPFPRPLALLPGPLPPPVASQPCFLPSFRTKVDWDAESHGGANVTACLRGPLGLGKRASNVRIVWFSFVSFGGVSFNSSAESKSLVQLRLL
ncbi:hypothetical protein Tco_0273897 [Tanacetum coccineum]